MRPDMSKVIVERPRLRFPLKNGSAYPRGRMKNIWMPDLEAAPSRERIGGIYATKWLNENLQPLVRYLRSNVGRLWNDVHSEISARISCKSAVQKHVLDHLRDYVSEHVDLVGDEVFARNRRWGSRPFPLVSYGMRFRFYVDPISRRLALAPVRKRKKHAPPPDPDRVVISNELEHRKIAGIWYAVTLAPLPGFPKDRPSDSYRPKCVVTKKRQLSSREISREGLRSDRK